MLNHPVLTRSIPLLAFLAWAGPIFAHHSFSSEFDSSKKVVLSGVVTKVEWTNPHTYFYLDVKDSAGKTVNWAFESAGPETLAERGWNRNSLKTGDRVTVVAYRAKDDVNVASAREVVLADGRKILAAAPHDGGPQH